MTAQRMAILRAFEEAGPTHPTAETIYALAKRHLPSIALGTVYRNLSKMAEAGEIVKIPVPDAPDRFDMDSKDHMHILCVECGRIYDIDEKNVTVDIKGVPEGVELIRFDVMAKCLCPDCKTK
ncbi:MAG: transcriptional repressor [Ruminococcaceae bacterium]|nr:transcriptional repressor [Oscillospiraceae bacterium]